MIWWLLLIPVLLIASVILFQAKDWITIRRKDCCGAGCGCLFPKKRKD